MRRGEAWFGIEDAAALRDVFAVYDAHVSIREIARQAEGEEPSIGDALRDMAEHWTPEAAVEKRAILRRAFAGEWALYEAALWEEGALYAQHGVVQWQLLTRVIARILSPALVRAHESEPRRLAAALLVMYSFLDRVAVTLGAAYLEHRERMRDAADVARKHAESAIEAIREERAAEALRIANGELEDFSSSVAHDLRAPLRAINGFARIVLDESASKLDAHDIDHLRRISDNAVRMGQLIDALLSLARVTRCKIDPQPTDLSAIARAIRADWIVREPARSVQIDVADGLEARVDPALAQTLLANLIANAWKFTSKKPSARIEIGGRDGTFFVRDDGAGFDEAYAAKLFTAFERLHDVRDFPGTGIGLATAHRIMVRHGGRIWANGAPDHGATFSFSFPR